MSKTAFSADDIVKVLKAFGESGISTLEYRDLKLVREDEALPVYPQVQRPIETPYSFAGMESPPETPLTLTTPEEDEEDRLELLKIENPVAYEEYISKRELEDVDGPS